MNFYKRHLGDYAKDTRHLTLIEHGAYALLLDLYYATEEPLPNNIPEICKKIGARTAEECEATASVLHEFFHKQARLNQHGGRTVWFQKRADSEIDSYKKWLKAAKLNGLKGGRPKPADNQGGSGGRTQNNHSHTHTHTQTPEPEPEPENRRPSLVGRQEDKEERDRERDAEGVNGSAKNAETVAPEIINRLGTNELKGLRTTLLRTVHDERMPMHFRNVCSARLNQVETRLRKKGIAV